MTRRKGAAAAAALALAGLVGFSATDAFAGLEFVSAEEGESWFANYTLDTSALNQQFDRIEITVDNSLSIPIMNVTTTTSVFETPNFTDASFNSDWAEDTNVDTSTFGAAFGTALDLLNFQLHFTGDQEDGVKWSLQLFLDDQLVGEGLAYYDKISDTEVRRYEEVHVVAVPLPPAAWSGLALLAGAGAIGLHRRRRMLLAV